MKLSEGILLGATLHPQFMGGYADSVTIMGHNVTVRTCALGAALAANGKSLNQTDEDIHNDLTSLFPDADIPVHCPVCGEKGATPEELRNVIVCLNDKHEWSRTRIAGWVEEQEKSREQRVAVEQEMVTCS